MIFNLTTHVSFPCKDSSHAILCDKNCGPWFGNMELAVFGEPFNKEDSGTSYTNNFAYNIPRIPPMPPNTEWINMDYHNREGINSLTNQKNVYDNQCSFTISELEVWGVSFIK
jgi:hypothetical protein